MTKKVRGNWQISETLFKDLDLDLDRNSSLGYPVEKVQVVECPEEFVKSNMRIKIYEDLTGIAERVQPINMKNPISGMSISGDEGETWRTMSQLAETDFFLRLPELSRIGNQTIRVESWMGGSNVLISSGPGSIWTAGQDGGNNICRGTYFTSIPFKHVWQQDFTKFT